jgi:hypothetical protein
MLMPKAAVNEDNLLPSRKNQVWLTGYLGPMQPKSIA